MQTIEIQAKIKGKTQDLLVDYDTLSPESVQIDKIKEKFSNQVLNLPGNILQEIELILKSLTILENASKIDVLMD